MEFVFTPLLLIPVILGTVSALFLANRKKVHEWNKRFEERTSAPRFLQPTFLDPKGRMNTIGGVLLLVASALIFFAIGTGWIET